MNDRDEAIIEFGKPLASAVIAGFPEWASANLRNIPILPCRWFDNATLCACLDCSWLGIAAELKASACPSCDGRVAEQGSEAFTARLKARAKT